MEKYAIIYASVTGNTEKLAHAICNMLPSEDCVYFGKPDGKALEAGRLYIGFWTDKGGCDAGLADFLATIEKKEIFLFGTAGFGGEEEYFNRIMENVEKKINDSNVVIGRYMCQGKMPVSVRERYEKMMQTPSMKTKAEDLLENFDRAVSHPDDADILNLEKAISLCTSK